MKILLLTFYYEPDLCAGSFRNTALVDALEKELGPEDCIEVVTTMPNRYHNYLKTAKAKEKKGIVQIYRIELPEHQGGFFDQIWSFKAYWSSVWKHLKNADTSQYDLIVASSSRLFTAFLGARVSKKIKKPLYLDIRDIFTETIDNVIDKKTISYSLLPIFYKIERYTINSAIHLNVVSGGFKNYFRQFYSGPISVFTNGIDEVFLKNSYESSFKNKKPVITFAGNIGKAQGLEKIVPDAAEKLSNEFVFQIIGAGSALNELKEKVIKRELDNVKLIEPVNREELFNYYKNSDYLFLHLNDYEAFKKVIPSKIFEYAATGKPIIAGLKGYIVKFIHEEIENVILFSPYDAEELVGKLRGYSITQTNRSAFVEKYRRASIMREMAQSIISYIK